MNNRNITRYIAAACMGLALMACQEDEWTGRVNSGFLVSLTDGTVNPNTRTAPAELDAPAAADFTLTIVRQANGETIYNATCPSAPIEAEPGVYRLTAKHGSNPTLALDDPYYEGQVENVSVNNGEVKQVSIPCKVANALLSVKYENVDKIAEVYSAYGVTVTVGDKSVKISHDSAESAYFQTGSSVEATFNGTLLQGGETKSLSLTEALPDSFKAGDHVILTLRVSPDLGIEITQVEVKTATVEETIPQEWLPRPKVSAEGFTNNTLMMYETETPTAKFNFNLSAPLQELKFTLNFADATYQSLNKTYTLSELSAEDRAALTEAGIVLPEIGATNASLDFSGLAAKLTGATGETLSNSITLEEVKANNRTQGEAQVYTIETLAPEFSLTVYPGDTWTKQFTATTEITHGNSEVILKDMVYEYSTNGTSWTTVQSSEVTGLTPGTNYKFKCTFRKYAKEVEVKTYPVITLENGNMESWTKEGPANQYTYWYVMYPWTDKDSKKYWNTVNLTTTQDGETRNNRWNITPPYTWTTYVANSGTISTTDSHSGYAALIRTVGWGSGSTAAGDISEIKHVTPGELYLGTYDLENHQPVYGIDYVSRPTGVTFWYKYEPKSTDLLIAQIVLMDSNGETIGSAKLPDAESGAKASWTEKKLEIQYTDITKAPARMYILFKSGTITDTDVMDKPSFGNLSDGESVGSKLYIDDISLVYDK